MTFTQTLNKTSLLLNVVIPFNFQNYPGDISFVDLTFSKRAIKLFPVDIDHQTSSNIHIYLTSVFYFVGMQ
jgi:hypothetical protein